MDFAALRGEIVNDPANVGYKHPDGTWKDAAAIKSLMKTATVSTTQMLPVPQDVVFHPDAGRPEITVTMQVMVPTETTVHVPRHETLLFPEIDDGDIVAAAELPWRSLWGKQLANGMIDLVCHCDRPACKDRPVRRVLAQCIECSAAFVALVQEDDVFPNSTACPACGMRMMAATEIDQ